MIAIVIAAILAAILGICAGAGIVYARLRSSRRDELAEVREQTTKLLSDAETRQKELLLQGKEEALQLRSQAENEIGRASCRERV